MLTAIEHGSVGPKRMAKAISESKAVLKCENFACKVARPSESRIKLKTLGRHSKMKAC